MSIFSEKDLEQIRSRGMSKEQVLEQIRSFENGFPPAHLVAPASVERGIKKPSEAEAMNWSALYDRLRDSIKVLRFIPASGAATRMFKALFTALEKTSGLDRAEQGKVIGTMPEVKEFLENLAQYPFYPLLDAGGDELPSAILSKILEEPGLNYGRLPKGLLLFHSYREGNRTALEEHLREAVAYCTVKQDMQVHLTVSPDHMEGFKELSGQLVPELLDKMDVKASISFSTQKEYTDTLAVDLENMPFRDEEGRLVFRPGGHGALLDNLNELDGDLVFISNIDNVAPDRNKGLRIKYKKVLGGLLLETRERVFSYLTQMENMQMPDMELLEEIRSFLFTCFALDTESGMSGTDLQERLFTLLNRPLRVCGMVRNQGEPGGGPFFVRNGKGDVSLQIVESSQIDLNDPEQEAIFRRSSHFNPVDLACIIRDYKGRAFDLHRFRDPQTGFISGKSVSGKEIKALELPGLWNGAMADWLTLFVEVPVETFSPVKTVFDLLRPEHRS